MCGLQLLMDQPLNDWDLQAVVRSCGTLSHSDELAGPRGDGGATEAEAGAPCMPPATPAPPLTGVGRGIAAAAAALCDLEHLDLDQKPFFLTAPSQAWAAAVADYGDEVMISFPAAVPSTSGAAQPRVSPRRKPVLRTARPKKGKKKQLKKVVREVPATDAADADADLWAWRKYGQKPIKGSPYPRGYYKCSSMKGCTARKMVERSVAKPGVLIITYMAEHCHPVPTQINALAGTTRQIRTGTTPAPEDHPATSPKSDDKLDAGAAAKCEDGGSNWTPSMPPMDGIKAAAAEDGEQDELWLAGMDDFFSPEFDHGLEEDAVVGRRISLYCSSGKR